MQNILTPIIPGASEGGRDSAGLSEIIDTSNDFDNPNGINISQSGATFTNTGASSKNYQNLPDAVKGLSYAFAVTDSDGFRINAAENDVIRIMDKVSNAGGYIDSTEVGSYVLLRCMIAGQWVANNVMGLWEVSGGVVSDDITEIVTGQVAFWDGKAYTSGQTLANSILEPADGAEQSDYDVYLGANGSGGTDEPTFGNNHFTFDGGDRFLSKTGVNTTLLNTLHKTAAGTEWTMWFKVKTGPDVATLDCLFGTASTAGDTGIVIRGDSSGAIKLDQYDGTGLVTKYPSPRLAANTIYDIFVAYDYDTNRIKFAVAPYGAATIETQVVVADFTDAITANATYPFNIGAKGDGAGKMEPNTQIYGVQLFDHYFTDQEVSNVYAWSKNYYDPIIVETPTAPSSIIDMPADTAAHFAWVVANDGGASISDYVAEYKLASEPTVWTNFSHASSGFPQATITGLTNGQSYNFRFAVINSAGQSPWSETITLTPVAAGTEPYDLSPLNKITIPVNAQGKRAGSSVEITPPDINTYVSPYFGRRDGVFIFKCPDGGATTSSNASYARSELRHLTNIEPDAASDDTLDFAVIKTPDGNKVVVHQIHGFGDDDSPWVKMTYTGKDNGTGILRALIQPKPTSTDPNRPVVTVTLKQNITNGDRTRCKIEVVQEGADTYLQLYIDSAIEANIPSTVISQSTGVTGVQPSLVGQPCRVKMERLDPYYYKRGNYNQSQAKLGDITIVEHYTNAGQYGE